MLKSKKDIEIIKLKLILEKTERELIDCCKENKTLIQKLAENNVKKIKHEAGIL